MKLTPNEKKLFSRFNITEVDGMESGTYPFGWVSLYQLAIRLCFMHPENYDEDVKEVLRKGFSALMDCRVNRNTEEYEELISLE